jgi:hypothetical protein
MSGGQPLQPARNSGGGSRVVARIRARVVASQHAWTQAASLSIRSSKRSVILREDWQGRDPVIRGLRRKFRSSWPRLSLQGADGGMLILPALPHDLP